MAGPKKPIKRDTPLSATPETGNRQNYGKEPVRSLSLSRANQLENRSPDKMAKDADEVYLKFTTNADKKYPRQSVNSLTTNADKKDAINAKRETEFKRADFYRYEGAQAGIDKKSAQVGRASGRMANENENAKEVMSKYKIPTKKKR
jgi:signal recognition particle subunit SEC65